MHTPSATRYLHHGPWSAELRGEELADIRYLGRPVLRGLRAVVRDHNWLTLAPEMVSAASEETPEGLRLVLETVWHNDPSRYKGTATLLFDAAAVTITFHGTAMEDFSSNRIGLVVLHRPDDAGRQLTVTSPDGSSTAGAFPRSISPHQPFMDIAAMDWERDGTAFRLDFDGEVFETEDQRNWTDASFKTYSTPLSRPFPVAHAPGDEVRQSIRLSARRIVRIRDEVTATVPQLGTSAGTSAVNAGSLPRGFGPLLVEVAVRPSAAAATISAAEAVALAGSLGTSLDARIVAGSPGEVVEVLRSLPLGRVDRLGVYDGGSHVTLPALWYALVREAKELGFAGEFVAGARSHFTELNRNRESALAVAAGISYSITPKMHAVEPASIVETLPMQTLTAAEALRIAEGRPVHVGPVMLAPRFNAVAIEAAADGEPTAPDPLGEGEFAAAWLLGSVAALSVPGIASVSYATVAEVGFPAGLLLQQLAELSGAEVLAAETGPDSGLAVYPVRQGRGHGLVAHVANLTPLPVPVRVAAPDGTTLDLDLSAWQTVAVQLP
ncbi:hypothetical protein [Arthrobacter celericrescens]|uniref:hypothetical protein n=1 Tax=Arthrobacter celericrescens TaxID=2320851 RepID=UPI000EA27844|nr:hypothetical protein [Arthrobacter celericrescens]